MFLSDAVGGQGLANIPLGGSVSNVIGPGRYFKSAKSAALRSSHALLSAAFPTNSTEYEATAISMNSGGAIMFRCAAGQDASGRPVIVAITANSGVSTITNYSYDGIIWQKSNIASAAWSGVAYGNGVFVAVSGVGGVSPGNGGTVSNKVATSTDGINWTVRSNMPAANLWSDVTFGGGIFVAVCGGGTSYAICATSTDGITWTSQTVPSAPWYRVSYGNGLFIATCNTSVGVITSPDGITWTSRGNVLTTNWLKAVYGNGIWLMVSQSGAATSPDGITWTAQTIPGSTGGGITDVAFGNGVFVVIETSGTPPNAFVSVDGINWTSQPIPAASTGYNTIAFCLGTFILMYTGGSGAYASLWAEEGASSYVYLAATAGTFVRVL